MGFVQQKSTSSVLPTTYDALLEDIDQNAEKYTVELVDESLIEEPKEEVKIEKEPTNEPLYFAEAYAVSNTVRFIGFLIDIMIISAISYLIYRLDIISLSAGLIELIVFVLYYLVFESLFCRTIGKMILRLKVVDIDGKRPPLPAIITRTIVRVIIFEAVSFVLTKGWYRHEYSGHWHDKWSDTYVISMKKVKEK